MNVSERAAFVHWQGATMACSSTSNEQQMEQIEDPSWFDVSFGHWDDDTSVSFVDESLGASPQHQVTGDDQETSGGMFLETLPSQLHPAVSLGVRRVSSCYFSIQSPSEASSSVADLLSLWDDNNNNNNTNNNTSSSNIVRCLSLEEPQDDDAGCRDDGYNNSTMTNSELHQVSSMDDDNHENTTTTISNMDQSADRRSILYHDIMMNVLSYLDAPSLASFSQTARRPNFECFYYLQLQLQRELVVGEQVQPPSPPPKQGETFSDNNSSSQHDATHLPPMAGVGYISRLSQLDQAEARQVVQEYLDSNSTLRTMPLSHSLAYLRDLLRRNGFYTHMTSGKSPSKALASAALLMTLVGAASFMSAASSGGDSSCYTSSPSMMMTTMMNKNAESLAEIPNMLLKVGLAGSIMNAARRSMSNHQTTTTATTTGTEAIANEEAHQEATTTSSTAPATGESSSNTIHILSMRETAEQMASMMQQLPNQLLHQLQAMQTRMMNGVGHTTATTTSGISHSMTEVTNSTTTNSLDATTNSQSLTARMFAAFSSPASSSSLVMLPLPREDHRQEHKNVLTVTADNWETMELLPLTPNPYEHLPDHGTVETVEEEPHEAEPQPSHEDTKGSTETPSCASDVDAADASSALTTTTTTPTPVIHRKLPSGCVGAFTRAIVRASTRMTHVLKEQRKAQFAALTDEQKQQTAAAWIDACSSDESLPLVREMVHHIDVDGFYVGSDGTETCALHAAAFSGAHGVLEFLCQGLDERHESADGGLAFVNLQDANGWTALHFAAGANSVSATQVLVKHGADLLVEAANGYTPLQWAQRLSNKDVVEELQRAEYHNQQQHDYAFPQYHLPYHIHQQQRRGRRGPQLGSLTTIASRFFALIPTHS